MEAPSSNRNTSNYKPAGQGGRQQRRNNANQLTFFVDVQKDEVARIVGRGGANIHRIQEACHCFIRSPPREVEAHEDGTVSFQIRGQPKACFQAYEMIREDLVDPITFSAAEVNLGRPQDVAMLIGPGGASIRKIMEKTNVKVITRPKEERSDLVVLEGLPEDVKAAHAMMVETIEAAKRGEGDGYRSSRAVVAEVAGANTPPSYHSPKQNSKATGKEREWGAPKQPKFNAAEAKKKKEEQAAAAAAAAAAATGESTASGEAAAPADTASATGGAPLSTAEAPRVQKVRKERPPPEASIEIPFPADKTGLLFGKEASTVKHIKRKSKAQVFVDVNALVVRVSGTNKGVEIARGMITKILERPPKKAAAPGDAAETASGDEKNPEKAAVTVAPTQEKAEKASEEAKAPAE